MRFNKGRSPGERLIGIYPAEGTFVADYPYVVMKAGWVSADERSAAMQLMGWLQRSITLKDAADNGFRLGNRAEAPIDQAHGADPNEPRHVLEVPSGDVLEKIQSNWNQDRKRASIMIAVDTSGTMSEEGKLSEVKKALPACLDKLVPDDRAGLVSFGDEATTLVPLGQYGLTGSEIKSGIADLFPGGRTALYDATFAAVKAVADERDRKRIDAVVVLTDGKDDVSKRTLGGLLRYLQGLTEVGPPVRVFAVVYGSDADRGALQQIVNASQGQLFDAKRGDISNVCRAISSFL